jgi:plasmid stabilization system protein ParE
VARKVIWTDPAVDDLEAAVEFVARDSQAYASALAQQVCDAGDSLAEFSERGRRLPDPELSDFRELFIGSNRLVYRVEPKRVLIVGVIHGRRDVSRALTGRKKS